MAIRRMCDDPADYEVVSKWLTDERVTEFYEGRDQPYPMQRVVEKFGPRARGESPTIPCLILLGGRPIGYIQFYLIAAYPEHETSLGLSPEELGGAYGLDVFIGEPELWNQGIGTRAVSLVLHYIFSERGASRVMLDPQADNGRAIRCYEKCGFRRLKLLPNHEMHEGQWKDNWLMAVDRKSATLIPDAGCEIQDQAETNDNFGFGLPPGSGKGVRIR